MTTWVSYQGKELGRIKLNDNGTNKFVFVAEGLEQLAQLFKIGDNEQIEIEGQGVVSFSEFQRKTLPMISAYFPTMEHWFYKNERAKSLNPRT